MAQVKGAKILVMRGDETLIYCRDTDAGIVFPGLWDVPGGKVEPEETPRDCALRELAEETGLEIAPDRLSALSIYTPRPGVRVALFRLDLRPGETAALRIGAEGHSWRFEPLARFLARTDSVPPLARALRAAFPAGLIGQARHDGGNEYQDTFTGRTS